MYQLANGLKFVLRRVPQSPIVTTKLSYGVGSSDEQDHQSCLCHFLEHLMFKGTSKLKPGDIDRLTLRHAGENNAYTTEDLTVYHFDFPAEHWETALEIEADRMRNLKIDAKHEFEQERGTVIEEFKSTLDEPWELEHRTILPLLFGNTGPYGRPVIGEREVLEKCRASDLRAIYDTWYRPDNAVLALVGGFDLRKAKRKINQLFGNIVTQGSLPERRPPTYVPTESLTVEILSKFENRRMVTGWVTVPFGHPDAAAIDVIEALLAGSRTGRLSHRLVEQQQLLTDVSCSHFVGRRPGWFAIHMEPSAHAMLTDAERAMLNEIDLLSSGKTTKAELDRAKRLILAQQIFDQENMNAFADRLVQVASLGEAFGLTTPEQVMERILAVTVEDVQRVAKQYLSPNRRVAVWSTPNRPRVRTVSKRQTAAAASYQLSIASRKNRQPLKAGSRKAGSGQFDLNKTKRVILPNGLTVLALENRRLPIMFGAAMIKNVRLYEPAHQAGLACLMSRMMEDGSANITSYEIADQIESAGGSLSSDINGIDVSVLSAQKSTALRLMTECLIRPAFRPNALGRHRAKLIAEIDENHTLGEVRANQSLRAILYGDHPFARPVQGTVGSLKSLTARDCREFHAKVVTPGNVIMAFVGDFNTTELIDEISELTRSWKGGAPIKPIMPIPERASTKRILSMPDSSQLHFFMGHLGITRKHPEFHKLVVMDQIFGVSPGFTDRLSARLRDREGLAYSVHASIANSATSEPGIFSCYVGTDPTNLERVRTGILDEIERIRTTMPTDEEVDDAKRYLLGSLAFQFTTNSGVAERLLAIESQQLNWNFIDEYRRGIEAVSAKDVQKAAEEHLHPESLAIVAAGPIHADGTPIR